jgi:hypothetical protein
MTCRLSNWFEAGLCTDNITAEGAAELVFDRWVRTFGLPARIVSDRDPRFTGRFWRELWRLLDTKLDMSTGGHPQTDGKAENRQRTANTMLRHYVDFEQLDWDMKLLRAAHAINHTKSVSSGLTPFEVMFRRYPRLPLDVALADPSAPGPAVSTLPAVTNYLDRHRYLWTTAKQNMLRAQSDQKRHADKHRREESFAVGDEVLLSTRDLQLAADSSQQHRAAKLTGRFVGPLKVTRVINPNAYELELPPQLRIHPVQNISKLRRYLRSPDRFVGRPQPLPRPPPECTDPAGDGEYIVERILAERRSGRSKQYLVKWMGYPVEESSWEPKKNLRCPDLLAEFEAQQLHSDADALTVLALTDPAAWPQTALFSGEPEDSGVAPVTRSSSRDQRVQGCVKYRLRGANLTGFAGHCTCRLAHGGADGQDDWLTTPGPLCRATASASGLGCPCRLVGAECTRACDCGNRCQQANGTRVPMSPPPTASR